VNALALVEMRISCWFHEPKLIAVWVSDGHVPEAQIVAWRFGYAHLPHLEGTVQRVHITHNEMNKAANLAVS
jgi:hypothetical protein